MPFPLNTGMHIITTLYQQKKAVLWIRIDQQLWFESGRESRKCFNRYLTDPGLFLNNGMRDKLFRMRAPVIHKEKQLRWLHTSVS